MDSYHAYELRSETTDFKTRTIAVMRLSIVSAGVTSDKVATPGIGFLPASSSAITAGDGAFCFVFSRASVLVFACTTHSIALFHVIGRELKITAKLIFSP